MQPLRVLHVLDHSWPILDGYAQRSRSIVNSQLQLGTLPAVLTGPLHQQDDADASDAVFEGVPYFRTPSSQGLVGRAMNRKWPVFRELAVVRLLHARLLSLLRNQSFDIVHAHSPSLCGRAAQTAARSCRIPFVYEIRAFWEDSAVEAPSNPLASMRYRLARNLETRVVRAADAVVGIAGSILRDLESRGIPSGKLFHVANGVDTARFTPCPRDSAFAAHLGLNDCPVLGFIGTLFPWEGLSWLVRAAIGLRGKGFKFKLLIVGDGAEGNKVRRIIKENNAADYVLFTGRVPHDQVQRYYSVIDAMVYPRLSIRLTELVTPLKPLEAMALGKAILGSDVGGIRELIEPEVTGILFKPGNTQDFEAQTIRILSDSRLRRALGESARRKVIAEKDWKTVVGAYEPAYAAAIRNRK